MSTLYLLPTPLSEGALHTLPVYAVEQARCLDLFLVERAKTARHFLKSIGHPKPMAEIEVVELPDDKQIEAAAKILHLAAASGRDVGLLSEAGCPGVADPGAAAVTLAHDLGMRVAPLVGPSSILLALMASGLTGQRFAFHGYLSPKRPELARDLRRLEQAARQHQQTQIFIETPYRNHLVLEVALDTLQANTRFGMARDLTGTQEWIRSLEVRKWKGLELPAEEKLPAIFWVG